MLPTWRVRLAEKGRGAHQLRPPAAPSCDQASQCQTFTISAIDHPNPPSADATLQLEYNGPFAIPDSLSDQSLDSVGLKATFAQLNNIMGTSYLLSEALEKLIENCMSQGDDFGKAYSRLRPYWRDEASFATLEAKWADNESRDKRKRSKVVDTNKKQIVGKEIPPRRVWDLYSNRVVPWWYRVPQDSELPLRGVWPLSHAWVFANERVGVTASVNGFEWPIPVPRDSSLERVRIELLNLGAEYAWLDVLCLRQAGGQDEAVRLKEWELDVPTIGDIYHDVRNRETPLLVYYNGLGRSFSIGDLDSERHWFNRVWTLQEAGRGAVLGGGSGKFVHDIIAHDFPAILSPEFNKRVLGAWQSVVQRLPNLWDAIQQVSQRYATNPTDKVAALASLMRWTSNVSPIYTEQESPHDAWERLLAVIPGGWRGELLFGYPVAGEHRYSWAPSWAQLSTPPSIAFEVHVWLAATTKESVYRLMRDTVVLFPKVKIGGLDSDEWERRVSNPERLGSVTVEDSTGITRSVPVVARHAMRVDPTIAYELMSPKGYYGYEVSPPAVVGVRDENGYLRKICVVELQLTKDEYDELCKIAEQGPEVEMI